MSVKRRTIAGIVALMCGGVPASSLAKDPPKPSMNLRVAPQVAFTPARMVFTAELRNVPPEDANFYCPTVEWTWGDGTQSVESSNCDPFEPGVSQLRTRYTKQNVFYTPGRYKVTLRLKQRDKVVLAGTASITVREGGYTGPP